MAARPGICSSNRPVVLPLAGWILLCTSDPSSSLFHLHEGNIIRRRLVFSWFLVVLLAYEGKLYYMERQFMLMELFFCFTHSFSGHDCLYLGVRSQERDSHWILGLWSGCLGSLWNISKYLAGNPANAMEKEARRPE